MNPSRFAQRLITAAAWLVPADVRHEWRREWVSELSWSAANGRSTSQQLRRASGAWRHALWLRSRRWAAGLLWQDVRSALRTMRARPGFTAMAIVTMALGIGANTAVFSVVYAVMLRRLPYPDAGQLASVYATHRKYDFDHGVERPEDIQYWMDHAQSTAEIAPIDGGRTTITSGGEPDRLPFSKVTPEFFSIMSVPPLVGRIFTAEEAAADRRVVVVSYSLWQNRLGGTRDLAKATLDLDGQSWEVIGVMPPAFKFPERTVLWLPFDFSRAGKMWYLGSVVRLKPGITVEQAQQEFDRMAADLERESPKARKDRGFNVVGLKEDLAYRSSDGLKLLQGVVALVLLIACSNVANLLLAQASARRRELSLRAALGASRSRLVRQLLTESVLLSLSGAALGAAIAAPAVRALVSAAPPFVLSYPDEIGVSWTVLGFTAALAIATGIVFGLVPALLSSRPGLTQTLGQGERSASAGLSLSRRQYFRSGLIAFEIALALLLLIGGGLLVRSFALLSAQEPGFQRANLLTASLSLPVARYESPESRRTFWSRLLEELAAKPGVTQAVMSNALPFSKWEWQTDFRVEGLEQVPNNGAGFREVSAGYFEALGIPVVKGRTMTRADRDGADPVVFVSDAFARQHLPGLEPLGHRIALGRKEPWRTIAGVVGSTRHLALSEEPRAEMYVPALQQAGQINMLVALRTNGDPAAIAPALREVVSTLDPLLPVQEINTMEQLIAASAAEQRFMMVLLTLFASLAVVLALIGVYGVMSFLVNQGRREIGIRLALGARPLQVQRRLLGQALIVVTAGAAVGLVAALFLSKLLESQLFEITPNDPATIATVVALLFVTAILACWIPARRTSQVDPTESLRES
jgi:putative ABC transport system permease protein